MTRRDAYVAALNPDDDVAGAAFEGWTDGLDPEDIDYPQHKLINIAYGRFGKRMAGQPLDGVFQNIQRQLRLRTHANLAQLRTLLEAEQLRDSSFLAIGETHEELIGGMPTATGMASIELAVPRSDLARTRHDLEAVGFKQRRWTRPALRTGGRIVRFNGPMNCIVHLVGLNDWPTDIRPAQAHQNLHIMAASTYWAFMGSRKASLVARRDQLLFDLAALHARGLLPGALPKRFGIHDRVTAVFGEISEA